MCELLIGLPAINVLGIDDERADTVVVYIESRASRPGCSCCGTPAWIKDRSPVELVDLPCFGRPARLVWHKHRWCCPDEDCEMRSWTGEDPRIAPGRGAMTDRAGRWACEQVGRLGRTGPSAWLEARPQQWRQAIRFGVLDLSGPYGKTFNDTLGHVTQVADPFHLVRLANTKLDECRRRCRTRPSATEAAKTTRSTGPGGC